jgi:uncharacterized protein YdhG (YjbR/CyaY superfamily)
MAQFTNGYINDLSAVKDNVKLRVRVLRAWIQPVKDNVKLRVRVLRAWIQPVFGKPHVNNLELIVMDEHVSH